MSTSRENNRIAVRKYYHKNKEYFKGKAHKHHLKRKYGMTPEDFNALFEKQGRVCGICKRPDPESKMGWCTDHNHQTGQVRGILCRGCNYGLGFFYDNPKALRSAIKYLKNPPNIL